MPAAKAKTYVPSRRLRGFVSFFDAATIRPIEDLRREFDLLVAQAAIQRYGSGDLARKALKVDEEEWAKMLNGAAADDLWDYSKYTLGMNVQSATNYGERFPSQSGGLPQFG